MYKLFYPIEQMWGVIILSRFKVYWNISFNYYSMPNRTSGHTKIFHILPYSKTGKNFYWKDSIISE